MAEKKHMLLRTTRIMHFETGSIIIGMIRCENLNQSGKASNIARIIMKDFNKVDINRISKVLESIEDGIYVEQEKGPVKRFRIIRYNEDFKSYSIDPHELFNLFLETLVVYPTADQALDDQPFFKDIKKEEQRFTLFIRRFADNFNFEEQDIALFELGGTLSNACALYLDRLKADTASPWYKLGEFVRNNSSSISESVKELI